MKVTKILAGILLALALGLALLAWMLGSDTPREVERAAVDGKTSEVVDGAEKASASTSAQPSYWVMGAKRPIAAGQRVEEADVEPLEKTAAVEGGFTRVDDLLGKTTVVALEPGQVFQAKFLVSGLSLQLEPGLRAVSIGVKEPMAVGNHIRPGDFVDVFFSLQEDPRDAKSATQARLLLARARVLAYGSSTVENPPATLQQRLAEQAKEGERVGSRDEVRGRAEIPNTAVLAVPLEDVQRLALAEKHGQLSLALRHPDDMALPDASLFAALPGALQPLATTGTTAAALAPIDKAYAGTKLTDLVHGGSGGRAEASDDSRRRVSRGVGRVGNATQQQTVELLYGNTAQAVSY